MTEIVHDGSHYHDVDPTGFVECDPSWIDRRALERSGWIIEEEDRWRGAPFERALHPDCREKAGEKIYPKVRDQDGPVVQIVYVPVGDRSRNWANHVWRNLYPNLYAWFNDDGDFRAARCHGVVFLKSDF